jgi:hypothetical protein
LARAKRGKPPQRVKCHIKYVFEDDNLDQGLAMLNAETGEWEWGGRAQRKSLGDIIRYIDRRKKKSMEGRNKTKLPEKVGVDAIVSNNPNVIDLEMGLPAWRVGKKSALRMDIVALERKRDGIHNRSCVCSKAADRPKRKAHYFWLQGSANCILGEAPIAVGRRGHSDSN